MEFPSQDLPPKKSKQVEMVSQISKMNTYIKGVSNHGPVDIQIIYTQGVIYQKQLIQGTNCVHAG